MMINISTCFERLREKEYHFYDIPSETLYFPFRNEEISMPILSNGLNRCAKFLNHPETFEERKYICEQDDKWISHIHELKKENNYTCSLSGITYKKAKQLSYDLFRIPFNKTWINNWLVPHHIDDTIEYRCFDKSKIKILNRAIHMTYHRYDALLSYLPNLKKDYDLWFELGCLIPDRNGEYPWRNIKDIKNKE